MAEWVSVCPVDDLREGRGRSLDVAGLRLAVFKSPGGVVVLSGRCPHAGGSLGHGWIEDGEVVCPLHRWRFRLSDGRCTSVGGNNVHRFQAEIRDDQVWAEV